MPQPHGAVAATPQHGAANRSDGADGNQSTGAITDHDDRGVYGARKFHAQMNRTGHSGGLLHRGAAHARRRAAGHPAERTARTTFG